MSKISLSKIGFFNPGRLSDPEIELGFIARQGEFKSLLENVLSHKPQEIPQHFIMIGQRGMGKTSLLLRIAVELKKSPHKKRFIPLQYPEEQYNIDRLSKFWLNSLDALADALDQEGEKKLSTALDQEIKKISQSTPTQVYPIFQAWTKKIGRCLVLMVDNLNLIFDKISTDEQHRLRAILMAEGAPILIGASAISIRQTTEYGAPFYDAFQIRYLKKLTLEESIEVLKNLAQITGKPLHSTFSKNRGRIATFHQLTGGTPRTLSMLFPLVSDGFSQEIQSDLDAVLDIITPLYKSRFEELSDQMQVIMDAIALHWDPIDLEGIRNITLLENPKLSPQLKRLLDVGWIQKSNPEKTKGTTLYEVSERFFNVWYLMRRSSRRQKRELYCLSKFLEVFYGDALESIATKRLDGDYTSISDAYLNLALSETGIATETRNALKERGFEVLKTSQESVPELLKAFDFSEDKIAQESKNLFELAQHHFKTGDFDQALRIVKGLLEKTPEKLSFLFLLADILIKKENFTEAEKILKKAEATNPNSSRLWNGLGNFCQYHLKRFEEAEKAYQKAIQIDENDALPWNGLGNLYQDHLKRFVETEKAYKKAIQIDENYAIPWNGLGHLYKHHLKQFEEAEKAYKKAIQIDENDAFPWNGLGNLYQDHLKHFEEAEKAYKKAIQIDENNAIPWNNLGNLYQNHLKRFEEAEKAYKKAIQIDENDARLWRSLGSLYQNHLKHFEEAEKAYKKAIQINENDARPWRILGILYQNNLNQFEEAEMAYKKASVLGIEGLWSTIGNLRMDYLHRYKEAEEAFTKALEAEDNSIFTYNLIFLYRDKLEQEEKAREMLSSISKEDIISDTHLLIETIFAYQEGNAGIAKAKLLEALEVVNEALPSTTQDDWWRTAAVAVNIGYGQHFVETIKEAGYDIVLRPYYEAIRALIAKDAESHFTTIAAEVREPAAEILKFMKGYIS